MKWSNDTLPILQLGSDFYDPVEAAAFPKKILRYWNDQLPIKDATEHFWHFKPLPDNIAQPLALRYHGHQFQTYNPNLGDGRGFLFAQLKHNNEWFDLGTKGSGQTPYSRRGDGRLTLKGAVREALATEFLEKLGVKTSRTLAIFETGESLERNDEPSPTRAAVLTRYSRGHIRIGTFQRLAFLHQIDNLKKLTSYSLFFYYPEIYSTLDPQDEGLLVSQFFHSVVKSVAQTAAEVMMAGFVHGVLNTDNINISGELFDYGPYRFLPEYDPQFTAAYFDHDGLYSYGRQPLSFLWALHQLGVSLKQAYPTFPSEEILKQFNDFFNLAFIEKFLKRLNLKSRGLETDGELIHAYFSLVENHKLFFEKTVFDFQSLKITGPHSASEFYRKFGSDFESLIKILEKYEVSDSKLAAQQMNSTSQPTTLLIDEIEKIWAPIADHDDWSLFNSKIKAIRASPL